jgi:hypothetical protein
MASQTDIQHHLGRTAISHLILPGSAIPAGTWVTATARFTNATLGALPIARVRYTVIGKTCIAIYVMSQTSAGTMSAGTLLLALPLPNSDQTGVMGFGRLTSNTSGDAVISAIGGQNVVSMTATRNDAGPQSVTNAAFGPNLNATWDLNLTVFYEIA